MNVGDRVRITESVVVYHIPGGKGQPVEIKGYEGSIAKIVTEWQGRPVSANFPLLVKFENPKFRAHLQEHEVEAIV
jgi:Ferredoxin thioredoxin reductase variable alpha chain